MQTMNSKPMSISDDFICPNCKSSDITFIDNDFCDGMYEDRYGCCDCGADIRIYYHPVEISWNKTIESTIENKDNDDAIVSF